MADRRKKVWRILRAAWITAGLLFTAYVALSFNAWGVDARVMRSGGGIEIVETDETISFTPAEMREERAGLLFLPGGMVEPRAYAPLLRNIAEAGHPAILVKLPSLGGRHAMGEEGRRAAVRRAIRAVESAPGDRPFLVAGHSLGGALAARVARESPPRVRGLVLIATTHPRDFSLASYPHPVVKVYATRDGVAPLERMKAHAANLPPSTRWIAIEGGNHSQFGYYGWQILDGRARITRAEQQAQVVSVLLERLRVLL